jgi:hypothetical protein
MLKIIAAALAILASVASAPAQQAVQQYYGARTSTGPCGANGTSTSACQPVDVAHGEPVSSVAAAIGGYTYTHIAAGQATTVIKATSGTLHTITYNGAATTSNVTTIYDNATGVGTVIGIANPPTSGVASTVLYDIAFTTGLTIITSVANGADMTVSWK